MSAKVEQYPRFVSLLKRASNEAAYDCVCAKKRAQPLLAGLFGNCILIVTSKSSWTPLHSQTLG